MTLEGTSDLYLKKMKRPLNPFTASYTVEQPVKNANVYNVQRNITEHITILTYLLTYGAEPFLRSCQLCSHSENSQQF
jgi:hypothetical protein